MTISDVLYLLSYLAAVIGVALLVGAFLSMAAAVGAALVVLSGALALSARDFATSGGET